jgi:uncharacterized protein (DUF3820 family)
MPKKQLAERPGDLSSSSSDTDEPLEPWQSWEFPFGKYKGKTLEAVCADPKGKGYIKWLLKNSDGEYPNTDRVLGEALASLRQQKKKKRESYMESAKSSVKKRKPKSPEEQSPPKRSRSASPAS